MEDSKAVPFKLRIRNAANRSMQRAGFLELLCAAATRTDFRSAQKWAEVGHTERQQSGWGEIWGPDPHRDCVSADPTILEVGYFGLRTRSVLKI